MGKESPKQQVTAYRMSLHFGICNGPAELVRVRMGEKDLWQGNAINYSVIGINLPELYGGIKAEGGAEGAIHYYPGFEDQRMSTFVSFKYGRTPETMTGYRGIASIVLTERIADVDSLNGAKIVGPALANPDRPGFYYSANSPYLRPIDVKVKRIPDKTGNWQASIAALPHIRYGKISPMAIFMAVGQGYYTDDDIFYPGYMAAIIEVLDQIIDYKTRSPDSRFDFGVTFSHSLFFPTAVPHNYIVHNGSVADFQAARQWAVDFVRTGGESMWRRTFEYMYNFFRDTLPDNDDEDVFTRRVAILLYNGNSTEFTRLDTDLSYGGLGDDVVTTDGGYFNEDNNTQVDCYAVISPYLSNVPDFTGAERFANQPLFDRTYTNQDIIDQVLDCVRPKSLEPDMNPAHIIYECLTDTNWGMGAPPTMLYLADFIAVAETLYSEEFGLSLMWAQQSTIESFIQEVLDHVQATLYVDPADGLIHLKLIRDDYDPDDLITLDKNNAKVTNFQRKLVSETINEIVVSWTNPENEQSETITAQDNANIAIQGGIVSDSRNYYGVRTKELATFLAWRDLAASSAPLVACEIEVDRRAWAFVPGGVVKLSWPEYGIDNMILRIGQIDYGKPGEPRIKLSCTEDIFGLDLVSYTVNEGTQWIPQATDPVPAPHAMGMTLNYALTIALVDNDFYTGTEYPEGFVAVLASTDAIDNYDFQLYDVATAASLGDRNILSRGTLAAAIEAEAETVLDYSTMNRSRGSGPAVGGFLLIGDDEATQELCYIVSMLGTNLTVKRGSLDTVPRQHLAGEAVWFLNETANINDNTIRSATETVQYKVLPRTNNGVLSVGDADTLSVIVNERPWLPTRPANVKVNGQGFGIVDLELVDPVPVTWAERNRLTEDAVFLPWDAATVAAEASQTTKITLMKLDRTVVQEYTGLTGTSHDIAAVDLTESTMILRVDSERDGYTSWQGYEITVLTSVGYYGLSYGYDYGGADPAPPGEPGQIGTLYPDNPDAETGNITGWTSIAADSSLAAASSLDAIEVPGSTPYDGTYSFYHGLGRISVYTTEIDVLSAASEIQTAIAAGKATAKLRYALLTDKDGGDRGSADLHFYDGTGTWIGGAMFDLHTSNNVWTVIEEGPIEIPAATETIKVFIRAIRDGDDNKLNVYVDNIEVPIFEYDDPQFHALVWSADGEDLSPWIATAEPNQLHSFLTGTSSAAGNGWGCDYGYRWINGIPASRSAQTPKEPISGVSDSDIDAGNASFILRWRQLNANNAGSSSTGSVTVRFYDEDENLISQESSATAQLTRNGAGNCVLEVDPIPPNARYFSVIIGGTRTAGTILISVHSYFSYMNAYTKKNS